LKSAVEKAVLVGRLVLGQGVLVRKIKCPVGIPGTVHEEARRVDAFLHLEADGLFSARIQPGGAPDRRG
jgi:hypothetical protein